MKHNQSFYDQLLVSPAVEALVKAPAEKVASVARQTAPVDSGAYRDRIQVTTKRQKRVVALVQATDDKSMIIEARTGNLARAVRAVGGRSRR